MEELFAAVALDGLRAKVAITGMPGVGESWMRDLRWAPFLASGAVAQFVCQIKDHVPLDNDVLVS